MLKRPKQTAWGVGGEKSVSHCVLLITIFMPHYFQVIAVVWRPWWLGEQTWTWTFLTWAPPSTQPASVKSWSAPGNSWGKVSSQHSGGLCRFTQTRTSTANGNAVFKGKVKKTTLTRTINNPKTNSSVRLRLCSTRRWCRLSFPDQVDKWRWNQNQNLVLLPVHTCIRGISGAGKVLTFRVRFTNAWTH